MEIFVAKFLSDDLPPNEWQRRRDLQARTGDPNGGIDPSAPIWALHSGLPSAEWHRIRALQASGSPQVVASAHPAEVADPRRDRAVEGGASTLMSLISRGEGTAERGGYDTTYGYGAYAPKDTPPLTGMTLDDVAKLQAEMVKRGAAGSVVGRYQMKDDTLERVRQKLGIPKTEKFTPALQDRMARELLFEKGYDDLVAGKISADQLQSRLSQEWSSLAEDSRDLSHYGKNKKARIGSAEILKAAEAAKAEHQRYLTESPYIQERLDSGYMPSTTGWR